MNMNDVMTTRRPATRSSKLPIGYSSQRLTTSFSDIAMSKIFCQFYYHFWTMTILDAVIDARLRHGRAERWKSRKTAGRSHPGLSIFGCEQGRHQRYVPVARCAPSLQATRAARRANKPLHCRTGLRRHHAAGAGGCRCCHHLLAAARRATLANAFHDEKFIRQEVEQMCDWLSSFEAGGARKTQ
jgi:hypothetical protein